MYVYVFVLFLLTPHGHPFVDCHPIKYNPARMFVTVHVVFCILYGICFTVVFYVFV